MMGPDGDKAKKKKKLKIKELADKRRLTLNHLTVKANGSWEY